MKGPVKHMFYHWLKIIGLGFSFKSHYLLLCISCLIIIFIIAVLLYYMSDHFLPARDKGLDINFLLIRGALTILKRNKKYKSNIY